jgi:hypothetical protein
MEKMKHFESAIRMEQIETLVNTAFQLLDSAQIPQTEEFDRLYSALQDAKDAAVDAALVEMNEEQSWTVVYMEYDTPGGHCELIDIVKKEDYDKNHARYEHDAKEKGMIITETEDGAYGKGLDVYCSHQNEVIGTLKWDGTVEIL